MYRESSSTGVKPTTLKTDASAQARSSIRRQQDILRQQALRHRDILRHREILRQRLENQIDPPRSVTRYDSDELVSIIDRSAQSSRRPTRSPDFALLDLRGGSPSLSDSARREAGQRLLTDALRHGQPGRRMRIPRESTLRFERTSPWPDAATLAGPRSSFGRDAESGSNSRSPDNDQPLPFTPGFAPARRFYDTPPLFPDGDSSMARYQVNDSSPPNDEELLAHEASNQQTRSPRRVGRRLTNNLVGDRPIRPRSTIDGLGDRQRSFSPDNDADDYDRGHDSWQTLLTTIPPDATLPSADSSFTSTAASTSASNNGGRSGTSSNRSGSQRSSNSTALTQPSSRSSPANPGGSMALDPYPEYLHPCDIPMLASDDDTETESDADRRFTPTGSSLRSGPPMYPILHPSNHPRYPRHAINLSDRMGSLHDSQSPLLSTLTPPIVVSQDSIDADLQQMQGILDLLARRDDIPEEWWLQVGLSRTGRSSSGGATPTT